MKSARKRAPARKKPSRIERTAYHEAGHAVAAYLRHWRFTGISIVPDRYTLGRCFFSEREIVLRTLDQDPEPQPRKRAALASRLKARCTEAAAKITRQAIQLHEGERARDPLADLFFGKLSLS